MSAPHPSAGGATDAEIAAALAALLAMASSTDPAPGGATPEVSAWRRATGPLPDAWPARGWRTPTRPRTWS